MSLLIYLWGFISLFFAAVLGCLLVRLCDPKRTLGVFELIPIGYVVGVGLITWSMLVLQCFGQPLDSISVAVPLALLGLLLISRRLCLWPVRLEVLPRGWSNWESLFLVGIIFESLAAFFQALAKPMESHDAVFNWALKGKAIFLAKQLPLNLLMNPQYPHADYPPLIPLMESYVCFFVGHYDDFSSKWIFPLFLLSCLCFLYSTLRRISLTRQSSLFLTFVLVSIPFVTQQASNGCADWPLSVYFSMSAICLYIWIQENERSFLVLSGLLAAFAALTKNEGFILYLLQLAILVSSLVLRRAELSVKTTLQILSLYLAPAIGVLLPWLIIRTTLGVQNDLINQSTLSSMAVSDKLPRVILIFTQYQNQVFGLRLWNLIWLILLLAVALRFQKIWKTNLRYLAFSIFGAFAVYTSVYLLLPYDPPRMDIVWYLKTTTSRLFLHSVPLAVFLIGALYEQRSR